MKAQMTLKTRIRSRKNVFWNRDACRVLTYFYSPNQAYLQIDARRETNLFGHYTSCISVLHSGSEPLEVLKIGHTPPLLCYQR